MSQNSVEKELNEYVNNSTYKFMYRAQAIQNSKTIKEYRKRGGKFDIMERNNAKEESPKMQTLDEYIKKLERGELIANIPADEKIEDFDEVTIKTPEMGDVIVYEAKALTQKRKMDAYKTTEEDKITDEDSKKTNNEKKENMANYRVVNLKDKDGKPFDLVLDPTGADVGTITYDDKGRPSFNMAPELKTKINNLLDKSQARVYVEEQTLQEEFYLKDVDALVRAIEEGKLVPENVKQTGERAIAAKNIKQGEYTDLDANRAIIETPEEIKQKEEKDEETKKKIKEDDDRLAQKQSERDIAMEEENPEQDIDEETRAIQTQPKMQRTDPSEKKEKLEDKENENKAIPNDKQQEIDEFCDRIGIAPSSIKAVLIVKDPKTLSDAMENDNIKEKGEEVVIIQYSTTTGAPKVEMMQSGNRIKVDRPQEMAEKFIEKYHMTSGVIKRTEDNDTYIDYTDSSGKQSSMKLKRTPDDMSLAEKENFRERLEKDIAELEMVRSNYPDNYELIDSLEIKVFKDFAEVGLTPPESIQEDAKETQEPEEPEKQEEPDRDDDDETYDEIGRRISPFRRDH